MKQILFLPSQTFTPLFRHWLFLAIAALTIAGIFSLPPVVLRGPYFSQLLPVEHIFSTALVIHVNLSVLFWMLAIGNMLGCLIAQPRYLPAYKAGFVLALIGTLLVAISPFLGGGIPYKNNYIPILHNLFFFIGIACFFCSILFYACLLILPGTLPSPLAFGLKTTATITLISFLCFSLAYHYLLPPATEEDLLHYYEQLFWGGGHILQFTFTNFMLIAWLILAAALRRPIPFSSFWLILLFTLQVVFVLPAPFFYLFHHYTEEAYYLFTLHMRYTAGIVPTIMGAGLMYGLFFSPASTFSRSPIPSPLLFSCLLLSFLLFSYGGSIGLIIKGSNAIIPAHYHGSIVGITLAFMGLVYHYLPLPGHPSMKGKLVLSQPWIYGCGQAMHITGLALMGGYGALRKAPGSTPHIDTTIGKLLFFSGGSFAIFGGLLFIILVLKTLGRKR